MSKIKEHIFQPILQTIGYYALKSMWRHRQMINRLVDEDQRRVERLKKEILTITSRILPDIKENDNVTVSLTSHGRRVEQYAAYAIYSILTQKILPNRIVLNINREKWTEDSLPDLIKKLQIAGLEVNLCEDVGPHTKLLPALEKYPDDVIITIDDDIFYGPDTLRILLAEYRHSDSKTVICLGSMNIKRDEDGHLLSYSEWTDTNATHNAEVGLYSPMGFRGVLYPPHIFSEEIFNREVYGKYCPKADDIWFTVMEIIDKIAVKPIEHKDAISDDLDHRNEYVSQNSDALHFLNDALGQNDVQIKALCDYYGL